MAPSPLMPCSAECGELGQTTAMPAALPPPLSQAVEALRALLHSLHSHPAGLAINALALALLLALVLRAAIGVLAFAWAYFLRPGRNLRRYGEWAVVTGATDGIGKAYCQQLAKQGGWRRAAGGRLHGGGGWPGCEAEWVRVATHASQRQDPVRLPRRPGPSLHAARLLLRAGAPTAPQLPPPPPHPSPPCAHAPQASACCWSPAPIQS